ncbi:hemagglutinin/amebocyte aggregation factor-like [Liolophura sinensis]|uniref:hemagglutinin/amebocyte aggregation factor-like n=1 Tax=Liolophura sinensis TaxID=3198878 RepID=UPI00315917F3
MVTSTLLLLTLLLHSATVLAWQNSWDRPLHFSCPENQYIYRVENRHDNYHEDRLWHHICRDLPTGARLGQCTWRNDQNGLDGLFAFRCVGNRAVVGVDSRHYNHREDNHRVFGFLCCYIVGLRLDDCYVTSFINELDKFFSYWVPHNHTITGMTSVHTNGIE